MPQPGSFPALKKLYEHDDLIFWMIVLAIAILWLGGLQLRGLFAPDEGRYAQIPQAMLATGDWVTPRLNGFKYFEKPPLQYWATAIIYWIFGQDEWTARLWPAITGLCGAGMIARVGTVLSGRVVGATAGLMLATSLGYFFAGQYLTLDMGLTFFLSAALAAFLLAERPGLSPCVRRPWMLGVWLALALAVLSKGLVGVVLPVIALGAYIAVTRDGSLLRRLELLRGGALFTLITLPWFVLVQHHNPEFFQFFFVHEHLQRFAQPGHQRLGPWWYFGPILLVGTLPWTPLCIRAGMDWWRERSRPLPGMLDVDLFLIVWAATVVVFFSASSSKLPAYILPALPPIILFMARRLSIAKFRTARTLAFCTGTLGSVLAGAGLVWLWRSDASNTQGLIFAVVPWLALAVLALLGSSLLGARLASRGHPLSAVVAIALSIPIAFQFVNVAAYAVDHLSSPKRMMESIFGAPRARASSTPFYSVNTFDPGVPFYLGQPVVMVGHRSELGPGIEAEPMNFIPSVARFVQVWRERDDGYAIMTPAQFERLLEADLPMHLLARDEKRVIVSRTDSGALTQGRELKLR